MSYKKNPFSNAPKKHPNKTRFNKSHEWKGQLLPGYLVPCMRPLEVLPGDEVDLDTEFFYKFANLYFPVLHRLTMRTDYYYIPNRILWEKGPNSTGWKDWLSKNEEVEPPRMDARMRFNINAFNINVLSYFGIPLLPDDVNYETHIDNLNALPLSAYLMIWDWYERIPQLEDERWFNLEDGDNTALFETAFNSAPGAIFPLLSARWEKDYFTSALPTPQVGDAIKLPLMDDNNTLIGPSKWLRRDTHSPVGGGTQGLTVGNDGYTYNENVPIHSLYLNIEETAGTIRQLREAEVLQSYYERIIKIGDRYDDFIEGLYGNKPQPGIINIPVLLGSKFGKVQIGDVMIQADASSTLLGSKAGEYRGQANLYGSSGGSIKYTCSEHGFIIAIMQINANTCYGQGIDRLWRRSVQTDYALDMFAHIGDQEILKEEVMFNARVGEESKNFETFGYIDRFSEYKWDNNIQVGNMNYTAGLSQHLGRIWDPLVVHGATYDNYIQINSMFTKSAPVAPEETPQENYGGHRLTNVFRTLPSGNVTGVQYPTEGIVYAWLFHSLYINRNLPLYSTPGL